MREVKKPEVRRAEILSMSKQLFAQKGYLNTTTQDIISGLKISRGLLYYHFKSKEDILWCIAEQQTAPLFKKIDLVINDSKLNAIEKIRKFFLATMATEVDENKTTNQDLELMESIQDAIQLPENTYMMDKINHRIIYRITEQFTGILNQGNKEGLWSVECPEEIASFLMTAFTFVMNDPHFHNNDVHKSISYYNAFTEIINCTLSSKEPILEKLQ